MPKAKSRVYIEAENVCRLFPDAPSRTLARKLSKKCKVTLEQARAVVRRVRGVIGSKNRRNAANKSLYRPPRKPGWTPEIPPSLSKKWEPFDLGSGIKVGILSDIHVPYHDEKAVLCAVRHLKSIKCDVLLINGDGIDFYSISRFERDPAKRNVKRELKLMRGMMEFLTGQFPKSRRVIKTGNHDERWMKYLWNFAPEISKLPQLRLNSVLKCKTLGWDFVDDQRPVMAGKLPIFHGHELGKGISSPVNPARGAFMRTISTVLVGHHHRTSQHTEPNWRHEEIATYSTGCLCNMTPEYARINKWNLGFAFVEVAADGQFDVENFRITSDYRVRRS